nr:hypothetical protein [Kluyvera intermedia]
MNRIFSPFLPWILLLLASPLLFWRAEAAGLLDPEDGMLDMSHYLQENPYGFFACSRRDY